jgi:hypothetical protein
MFEIATSKDARGIEYRSGSELDRDDRGRSALAVR